MFKNILVVVNEEDFETNDVKRLVEDIGGITKGRNSSIVIPRFLYLGLYNDKDLVISIGGDGTFLASASHIDNPDCYIFGINPKPQRSVGYLVGTKGIIDLSDLEKMLNGEFSCVKRQRANVSVNNMPFNPALNEVLFGVDRWGESAVTYRLEYSRGSERQRATGVIIATGTGSTGMYESNGGEPFSQEEEYLRFKVVDPYRHGVFSNTKYFAGEIKKGERIKFASEARYNCAIKQDGKKLTDIHPGDIVEVSLSDRPLNVISTKI